ncbi:MAG: hypothetical protein HC822_03790 [Oscillochloris sp.]|nr:hypothetical protein [Oscillochloris sp.]
MITIVVLIALVLVGGLAALNAGRSDPIFMLLALGLLIVSFRQLLTWPDDERRRYGLTPSDEQFAPLQQRIQRLAVQVGLPRSPILLITAEEYDVRVFGSWRRWYIGMDRQLAERFLTAIDNPQQAQSVDAVLVHELFHFRHNDNIWMGLARSLLRNGLILNLWFGCLIIGMVMLANLAQDNFFANYSPDQLAQTFNQILAGQGGDLAYTLFGSQEEFERIRDQAQHISFSQTIWNIVLNIFPFLLFGGILLLQFWRRFLRLREVYADAGVAQIRGEVYSLIKAIPLAGGTANSQPTNFAAWLGQGLRALRTRYLASDHDLIDRINYLHHPEQLYGVAWKYGLLSGFFVNFLNLVLVGTSAILVIGNWPLHFPVVASVILIALYLLPALVMGSLRQVFCNSLVILMITVAIYGGLVLFVLILLIGGALIDPAFVNEGLELAVNAFIWYSGPATEPLVEDTWGLLREVALINLLQIPTLIMVIGGSVALLATLIRRMLTWYGMPQIERRLMRAVVILILLVAAFVGLAILPPISDLILRRAPLSLPSLWFWAGATIGMLGCLAFGIWFLRQDRRYAGRCPHCSAIVPGPYMFGRRCDNPACNQALHPWLEAHYRVEAQP